MSDAEENEKKSMEKEAVLAAELEKYHNILGFKIRHVRGNGVLKNSVCFFSRFTSSNSSS